MALRLGDWNLDVVHIMYIRACSINQCARNLVDIWRAYSPCQVGYVKLYARGSIRYCSTDTSSALF